MGQESTSSSAPAWLIRAAMADALRPNDRDLLRSAIRQISRRAGVDVMFAGLVARDGLTITEFVGTDYFGSRDTDWQQLRVRVGEGMGGRAIAQGGAVIVPDYLAAETISHQHDHLIRLEGLQSMVAVPIMVQGRPRGVLYASTRERVLLGERAADLLTRAGHAVGHEFRLRDEVDRRIQLLQTSQPAIDSKLTEHVREAHAELRAIATTLTDPDLVRRLLSVAKNLQPGAVAADATTPGPKLSRRELDVLVQVALGCTYAETGDRLALKAVTVKSYMRSVMTKLGAGNRVEAIAIARRHGLIP
jgi:DNA-binding CsgD family transcriptional regulator/putative methionine-R-sulfoxide reductase with GAF domain